MFTEYYWFSNLLRVVDKIPREVTAAACAYAIFHRHTEVRIAEAEAQVKIAALEVKALEIKRELQNQTQDTAS